MGKLRIVAIECNYTQLHLKQKKKSADILLHYRQLFVKGNVIIGEWGIFGVETFPLSVQRNR